VPIIQFLLVEHCSLPHVTTFAADVRSGSLSDRVSRALDLHPCDLLFVHRDADSGPASDRDTEIRAALSFNGNPPAIVLVPVRMTETWLLVDELAIRRASGNLSGTSELGLPQHSRLEKQADPKTVLFGALQRASGLGQHRLRRFDLNQARRQVSGFMEDHSILRALPSFVHFETQVKEFFSRRSS
jgi:hypothetical protein